MTTKLLAALALALSLPSSAATTYTYVGSLTNQLSGTNSPQMGQYPSIAVGQVTLAASLAPNQLNQVVTPISYIFNFLPVSPYLPPEADFVFDTANGLIIGWHISIQANIGGNVESLNLDSSLGDSFSYTDAIRGCAQGDLVAPCNTYQVATPSPGQWSYSAAMITLFRNATMQYEAEYLGFYTLDVQLEKELAK